MSFALMTPEQRDFETTDNAVLGGRLRLRQTRRGHRFGHDAILLAAATAAFSGERAVDLGAGVGAAGLALAARVPGLAVTLIDIDENLCALAAENASKNGMADNVNVLTCDVEDKVGLAAAGLSISSIDRVLMNPPFNDPHRQSVSPDPRRRLAHVATSDLLTRWIETASWLLKPKGVLTMIWRAEALNDVLASLNPAFGNIAVLPIYPRVDAPAIRIIVQATYGGDPGESSTHELILNDDDGRPTKAAEAILRGGEPLYFQPRLTV
jgi:tRNA1(Val) A37 N6-methylase TrmN6